MKNCSLAIPKRNIEHSLAVADIYFKYLPNKWIYEPRDKFKHGGDEFIFAPDCTLVIEKDGKEMLATFEMQLSELTGKTEWPDKWKKYNIYFGNNYYKKAAYQEWFKEPKKPRVVVISSQNPEVVKKGFNLIDGKDLIIRDSL